MIATIQPGSIKGNQMAPASKSSMQRACAAALLHQGTTIIINPGNSNDDQAALGVIRQLGATIFPQENGSLQIVGASLNSQETPIEIHCGESGLGIRMFAPIAALRKGAVTITGSGSLLTRPMDFFDEIFPQLGIHIQSHSGKLPIALKGPLQANPITIDGSLSSQFLTGLLMAFANAVDKPVTINVLNLKSRPYIDLTLQVMQHFGWKVQHENYEQFTIFPVEQAPQHITYQVEGDWSGAAFLLVAGALAGNIRVEGLDVFSTQADKAVLQALMATKAPISIREDGIELGRGNLQPFHFDATDCPDLFPPLVALAAACNGRSVIEGVSRLAHKESNRGLTLQQEFGKMGIDIQLQDDLMIIDGGTGIRGASVHSHHDHRIAMACAVAGLRASDAVVISDAEAIDKSYPDFYRHLQSLGASVSLS